MRSTAEWLSLYLQPEADWEAQLQKLQEPPRLSLPRWILSLMAQATEISRTQLQRWRSAAKVQPHPARTYKRSNASAFEVKLRDVLDLFPNKTPHEIVLAADAKL